MHVLKPVFSKTLRGILFCFTAVQDLALWCKEFFISCFDRRIRYFVYGLSCRDYRYASNYYYRNFLPIDSNKIRLSIYNPHIRFYEPFSAKRNRKNIKKTKNKLTVFITGECVHSYIVPNIEYYSDHCVSCSDISLGFDYLNEKNYIRFPYWLLRFFPPTKNKDDIAKLITEFNNRTYPKTKFCSLIASHDITHIRTNMIEIVNKIDPVMCPGTFMHNDSSLHTVFYNNKHKYLEQFKFNLCPENDVYAGYVTEKIFDALCADCIPIYWGGDRPPEPEVINSNAIILLDPKNPQQGFEQIKFLHTNPKAYHDFKKNKKFNDSAVDWIYTTLQSVFILFEETAKKISYNL